MKRISYEMFRSDSFTPWESTLDQVCERANEIGQEHIISISHSEDKNTGVAVIWYWTEE